MKKSFTFIILLGVLLLAINLHPATVSAARLDGTLKGCTIWLTQSTSAYQNGRKVATLSKGKKYKAIRESGNHIFIKMGKSKVYIDSTYVLINVKEYIPSLEVKLDMANKNNFFNMGSSEIKNVSDKKFYTSKGSKNGTACWLRYLVAKKLLTAQKAFQKDGYGIVIYDAYRPYSVTCRIRNAFSTFLRGKTGSYRSYWFGSLGESWFLAQGVSAHNYGRAIDMSLCNLKTKKLLKMPSTIHTLDKRSSYDFWAYLNTTASKNALYMKKKMETAGFTYLRSEWWHFQDNAIPCGPIIDLKI